MYRGDYQATSRRTTMLQQSGVRAHQKTDGFDRLLD